MDKLISPTQNTTKNPYKSLDELCNGCNVIFTEALCKDKPPEIFSII